MHRVGGAKCQRKFEPKIPINPVSSVRNVGRATDLDEKRNVRDAPVRHRVAPAINNKVQNSIFVVRCRSLSQIHILFLLKSMHASDDVSFVPIFLEIARLTNMSFLSSCRRRFARNQNKSIFNYYFLSEAQVSLRGSCQLAVE